jgi:thymidine phosphorylase
LTPRARRWSARWRAAPPPSASSAWSRCSAARRPSSAKRAGFVEQIDVRAVGIAVVELGGGRARASDRIDPAVGFTRLAGLGAEVSPSAPLALVHARDEARAFVATESLRAAYQIADAPPAASDPVVARIAEGSA